LAKRHPVCPMYVFLQSGQVSLYAPERVYLSGVMCLCTSRFWRVLLVLSAKLRSVF
jgi:hypothetical protein